MLGAWALGSTRPCWFQENLIKGCAVDSFFTPNGFPSCTYKQGWALGTLALGFGVRVRVDDGTYLPGPTANSASWDAPIFPIQPWHPTPLVGFKN